MGRGLKLIAIGFLIGIVCAFIPIIGIPGMIIGGLMMCYGVFVFWFGVGKKGIDAAKRAGGDKTGTGKL